MLSGAGFTNILNLSGGIKAWQKEVAVGPEDTGLELFPEAATPLDAVIVGYGLESGLREFYLSMQARVSSEQTKRLFAQLADIEIVHQDQLVALYGKITGLSVAAGDFAEKVVGPAMEGGLSTDEYLELYDVDLESEIEVLSLAMAIEAQALDLYLRAARGSENETTRKILLKIGEEERSHIGRLSDYIDQMGKL
jgi:rubrerythrin